MSFLIVAAYIGMPEGPNFRADMLALLPDIERQPRIAQASAKITKGFEQNLVITVTPPVKSSFTLDQFSALATELDTQVAKSELFLGDSTDYAQLPDNRSWFSRRYQLLTDRQKERIQEDPDAHIASTKAALYHLMATTTPIDLVHDPLGLSSTYQASFVPADIEFLTRTTLIAGSPEQPTLLQMHRLKGNAFDLQSYDELIEFVSHIKEWGVGKNVSVLVTGLPIFAAHGAQQAQFEISTFGTISLFGVILLLLGTFKSARPLLGTLTCMGVGIGSAMVTTQLVFGEIHLLTMVFGASLIGISVDYALHYLCDAMGKQKWSPHLGLQSVFAGITLALATSVFAFLSFLFTPFPGLQQIAVFSASGLLASWLTVIAVLPYIGWEKGIPADNWPMRTMRYWVQYWPFFNKPTVTIILFTSILAIAYGLANLKPNDSVQVLQSSPPELIAEDAKVRNLSPFKQASQFFVVSAENEAAWLAAERDLVRALESGTAHQGQVRALSSRYPNIQQQRDNYELIKSQFYDSKRLHRFYQSVGVKEDIIAANELSFNKAFSKLSVGGWLASASERQKSQWLGCDDLGCRSIVFLETVVNKESLSALAASNPNFHWVDQVGAISELLHNYRLQASKALTLVYGLAALFLITRFGLRGGLRVISVPLIAAMTALAVTGIVGNSFNLFSLMALMVVAGIGIDYAIFYRLHGKKQPSTSLAITLSAVTTMLAFGLLSVSSTAVVHTFGVTLLVGILTAFLISPFAAENSLE